MPWLLGVVVVLVGIGMVKQALKRYEIQNEINTMQQSVADLQLKNGQLLQLLSYVKSPTYSEEQQRLQLGLAKPGEHMAVIPEGMVLGASSTGSSSTSTDGTNTTNHWKWWSYFFPTSP